MITFILMAYLLIGLFVSLFCTQLYLRLYAPSEHKHLLVILITFIVFAVIWPFLAVLLALDYFNDHK